MKGNMIIGLFACIWVAILVYITFYSTNPFINTAIFFFGAMFTVCGFAYGCEEIEKKQIVNELNTYGILTVLSNPKNLTVNVLNKYLEIPYSKII